MIRTALLLLLVSVGLHTHAQDKKKTFDHSDVGFDLVGTHSTLNCADCHTDSNYKGTPRECFTCHAPNGLVNATFKSAAHPMTTQDCEACHMPTIFEEVFRVDHTHVLGACESCHMRNGGIYNASGPAHAPEFDAYIIGINCDGCHSTLSWAPAFMQHDVVGGVPCASCHNDSSTFTNGKPIGHPPTTDNCEACHSTDTWEQQMPVLNPGPSHTDLTTDDCTVCHNGFIAPELQN